MKKICGRCKIEKLIDKFGKNKNSNDGKNRYCKDCELKRSKEYRENHRDKINLSSKNYRKNNPKNYKESIDKYLKKKPNMTSKERMKKNRQNEAWKLKNNEQRKKYYRKNKDKFRAQQKKYYQENKEKVRKLNNAWKNKKRKEDGFYRMKINLRNRIREYLIGDLNGKRTKEIVGLDKENFKSYIQNKFTDGMSWDNYGKWHLDHIIPLCNAKNNNEALLLNHYSNLQPLWAEDNLRKNRKI